jgi:hypothetical protein
MRVILLPTFTTDHTNFTTDGYITVYDATTPHAALKTINIAGQPNSLCTVTNPSPGLNRLFVSTDHNTTQILSFDLAVALDPTAEPVMDPMPVMLSNGGVGMAIQPGTGDLLIATAADRDSVNGGVLHFLQNPAAGMPPAPGMPYQVQQGSLPESNTDGVPVFSANLAFDPSGGLWLSGFNPPQHDPAQQYLTWFPDPVGAPKTIYKLINGAPFDNARTFDGQQGRVVYPLSQPEGLAFDPFGNLWLACNDDDYGVNTDSDGKNYVSNGTLVCFSAAWLANLRTQSPSGPDPKSNGIPITETPAGVTIHVMNTAKFGGLAFDGTTLYANDQGSSVVWRADIDVNGGITNWAASGIPTSYPGNGQMVVVDSAPAQLTIRDNAGDTGTEPGTPGVFWESPDIVVLDLALGAVELIVTVHNTGAAPSTGSEILKLYWAMASSGLAWPAAFDGVANQGGIFSVQPLPVIPAGAAQTLQCVPTGFLPNLPGMHVCILARIESTGLYPFGMTFPEKFGPGADSAYNVQSNRGIAQHNVVFPNTNGPIVLVVRPANHDKTGHTVGLHVTAIDRHRNPIAVPGRLTLKVAETLRSRLMALHTPAFTLQGEELHLHDPASGLKDLLLHPHEVLELPFSFHPHAGADDFALRFIQTEPHAGKIRTIGGQTFVFGTVEGLHRPKRPPLT